METCTLAAWLGTFGFFRPDPARTDADIYVHRQEFERGGITAPRVGEQYAFDAVIDTRRPGRRRAVNVREG